MTDRRPPGPLELDSSFLTPLSETEAHDHPRAPAATPAAAIPGVPGAPSVPPIPAARAPGVPGTQVISQGAVGGVPGVPSVTSTRSVPPPGVSNPPSGQVGQSNSVPSTHASVQTVGHQADQANPSLGMAPMNPGPRVPGVPTSIPSAAPVLPPPSAAVITPPAPGAAVITPPAPGAAVIPPPAPSAAVIPPPAPSAAVIPPPAPSAAVITPPAPSAAVIPPPAPSAAVITPPAPSAAVITPTLPNRREVAADASTKATRESTADDAHTTTTSREPETEVTNINAPPPAPSQPSVSVGERNALAEELDLFPLEPGYISEMLAKHVDPKSPPPVRMMAARAMVPMAPKDMVHIVYQAMFDGAAKIAAAARKTFESFEDRVLNAVVAEPIAPQVLGRLAIVHAKNAAHIEKLMLNKQTPDAAYSYVARHTNLPAVIGLIVGNQERLMRYRDIVRSVADNPTALRSDLDKAIDFLVRQGVFLEDVPEFESAFLRLGKAEMLEALKKVELSKKHVTVEELKIAKEHNLSIEEVLLGNHEAVHALLEDESDNDDAISKRRSSLLSYTIPEQLKLAMVGDHSRALEALQSTNKLVAAAGIRNPRIKENDVQRIIRSRGMHEEVIRYICNNNDWTKSYTVKLQLVQHPKTPPTLMMRWLPLMRQTDLKQMAKSKQIPSNVSTHAKRLVAKKQVRQ